MKTYPRFLVIITLLLTFTCDIGFGWGGQTHRRITYWAWKYSGLPPSSGEVVVPIVWNLDSVKNTLGFQGYDLQGYLLSLFTGASGADFNINTTDTIKSSESDSALFFRLGRRPDDFDGPTRALGAMFGHMYIPAGGGFADGMCKFYFNTAVREYKAGHRRKAYAYLAYASHYIADVGFPPHNEKNFLDPGADIWQAVYHEATEDLIGDSAFWYPNFDATCDSFARAPLPACDPVVAVHGLAWECCWYDQEFKDASVKADKTEMIEITKKCLRAIVPRVAGLFLAFKQKVL